MTQHQQKKFVRDLSDCIAKEIVEKIDQGRVPPEWDGHELRMLLAGKHAASGRMTIISNEPQSKRARDYRNTTIVNNL